MPIYFFEFLRNFTNNSIVAVSTLLTLGVILVNGWTDAPNAIATCVATRAIRPSSAILMAAIFNLLGSILMTALNTSVATTIFQMVDLGNSTSEAITALCAALFAIVVWATLAWRFGIPTSESHSLIAGLTGAAVAMHDSFAGVHGAEWMKVLYGLLLSTVLGFAGGFVSARVIMRCFLRIKRDRSTRFFARAQIAAGASMAFLHGAQDGQKFMGVFLLSAFLAAGYSGPHQFTIPFWLMLLCSLVMALGTGIGGKRIIKSVGMDMVSLEPYQGFAADLAAAICLLFASLGGIPVSTTHTKTTAIMGVGAAKRLSSVNWCIVRDMILAWVLTFPGCGLLSFCMVKLALLF